MRQYFKKLTTEANTDAPDELADELMLLAEGAIVMAYVAGDANAAARAKATAGKLI